MAAMHFVLIVGECGNLFFLCEVSEVHVVKFVLEECNSQYIRLLYWRDASHNTLDYCIGGMHLTIH